jgi:proline dehydrogenase
MPLARALLLRASRSPWLAERVARQPFARRAVRRFMPGETPDAALAAAATLAGDRLGTVLTCLGERTTDAASAAAARDHYLALLDAVHAAGLPSHISVKPTHLGLDVDDAACGDAIVALARRAAATGSFLWIDMEESWYVDRTLALWRRARAETERAGVCLQTYLRRTPEDLEGMLAYAGGLGAGGGSRASGLGGRASGLGERASGLGERASGAGSRESGAGSRAAGPGSRPSGTGTGTGTGTGAVPGGVAVRLVKGAYREARDVAYARKRDTDEAFAALAERLLETVALPGALPVLGTHDLALVNRIRGRAGELRVPDGAWELHALYGIHDAQQRALAASGVAVRTLISYGNQWFPWYLRRLAERPANVWFVVRSLVG